MQYSFKKLNLIVGWLSFVLASTVYLLTMEPTASFWDCSEFIATSYKLEVGHPPGAPLFMMISRFFTMFGGPGQAAVLVNSMSALASGATVMFLFWTITHLARRAMRKSGDELTLPQTIAVLGAGLIGAGAYTFTDTFWFSAVEGEVYALSSMFTALVFWAILKWENVADEPHANRWIVLIAYLTGLAIGVHLLNLLIIPPIALIYYFRKYPRVTKWGVVKSLLVSAAVLIFVMKFIIAGTVNLGAFFDRMFVNGLGLPVNSGITHFALALIIGLGWAAWAAHRRGRVLLNIILLSTTMILVGYSSYASVTIRAAANPPMNSNNPNNPHALLSLLNRDQYGDRPLLYGAQYSAPPEGVKEKKVWYLDEDGKYKTATVLTGYTHAPEFMQLFPRMWNYSKGEKAYKEWAAYRTKTETLRDDKGEVLRDAQGRPMRGETLDFGRKRAYTDSYGETRTVTEPTFWENVHFFFNYQLSYMYWRYFMWNFVGRQSDIQPSRTTITDGNWLSGIRWIDEKYVGPQDNLPREIAENKGRNTYYFLPFLLGLIGLVYQLNRDQRNFSIVLWLFVMMGIALVFYFNTSPGEPRERDYVYAGSFYAFSIWIGFGVLALRDLIARLSKRDNVATAAAATVVAMSVPAILAAQNWDDHDRSHRTMARDIGWNYLQSTLPNSIILNYGDNDTFPLWNNQEVYGVRPDVRIMNTSYLGGEWYIDEMKTKANDAPGVPFSLPKHKYTFNNDMIYVTNSIDRPVEIKEVIDFVRSDDPRSKVKLADGTLADYIPAKRIALPVNKENALASGIVAEKDRDKMVDTVFINIKKNSLDKNQLMILDMLANFDWKRPIYMTQVYILQDFGLMDYLQFDGYAYRLVPILTPTQNPYEIGRIDADYAAPLLRDTFRYGNLEDPRVYADYFIQYNLSASHARDAFARVAKELLRQNRVAEAVELLDLGLERMPTSQVRFTDTNTYPFLEAYYAASAMGDKEAAAKGDALLREYAQTLIEYIEHYLRFEGAQGDMVSGLIDEKLDQLGDIYYLASYADRKEVVAELNDYYRSLGVSEENLIDVGDKRQQPDSALLPAAK